MKDSNQVLETEHIDAQQLANGDVLTEDESVSVDAVVQEPRQTKPDDNLKAIIEAAIYITDEPLTAQQIATAIQQPLTLVKDILGQLVTEYMAADRGLSIRELAGGYKMSTKPEYHESIRSFVHKLQPASKLSMAALETLAVVAYKQPITAPEIMEVRGVQGAGVLKTLLDRKLIAAAGRKNVLGKPILYRTTSEFLLQFGLNSLAELPTLKEFEELGRFAMGEEEIDSKGEQPPPQAQSLVLKSRDLETGQFQLDQPESNPESGQQNG